MSESQAERVVVFKDEAGEWRWRALAGNGEEVAASGEGYVNHDHAFSQAHALFPDAEVIGEVEQDG